MSDTGDISEADEDPSEQGSQDDELREDPSTGSTPTDPDAQESGLPPAGDDPMAGEAPSG